MSLKKAVGQMYPLVTQMSWPYIAGFFDGEGGLFITKQIRKDGRIVHRLECSITNTNREAIYAISKFISKRPYDCRYKHPVKVRYDIRFCGKGTIEFLKKIKRFVVAKQEQINIAFEFQARMKLGRKRLSPEELDARDELMLRLKKVNGRKGGWPNALKKV